MTSICAKCKHVIRGDIGITPIGSTKAVKVNNPSHFWGCRKSIIDPGGEVDHISGGVSELTYRACRKVNRDGNCDMFEKPMRLRDLVLIPYNAFIKWWGFNL